VQELDQGLAGIAARMEAATWPMELVSRGE
jgi:hypothetical protein